MRYVLALVVLLSGCSAPAVRDDPRGASVEPAPVLYRGAWHRIPSESFKVAAKWNETAPDSVGLIAYAPGYADIEAAEGLRFSCTDYRLAVSSNEPVKHSLDGEWSSRQFVVTRNQFARLLACQEFDMALVTDKGVLEGSSGRSSAVFAGFRGLAQRITQLERWKN
jgi:hypothetical protein